MTRAMAGLLVWVLAVGLLVGCSRSKEDLVQKSQGVTTRAELEQAAYKTSNGTVVFLIVGHKVTLQATGSPADEKTDRK